MPDRDIALGLLVPASNRVLEQDFARWLPAGWRLHVNRLDAPRQRPADMRENLLALTSGVDQAARLLGLVEPDVVAFGCTSGSFLRGAAWDEATAAQIHAATGNAAVVMTAPAVAQALRALGARRIAAISPYPEAVNRLMRDYLAAQGFELLELRAFDGWGGGGIHKITAAQIEALAAPARHGAADALFASCTNLRAGAMVERLEEITGKPVVTSNQATFWACARAAGMAQDVSGLGRLGGTPA